MVSFFLPLYGGMEAAFLVAGGAFALYSILTAPGDSDMEDMQLADDVITKTQEEYNTAPPVDSVPGWVYKDNIGGGNCFYLALADAFNSVGLEKRENWHHTEVRVRNTGHTNFGTWNTQAEVLSIPLKFEIVLAFVHNQTDETMCIYRYYFRRVSPDGSSAVIETLNSDETPLTMPLIRIAYTGYHYKAVVSEPESKKPARPYAQTGNLPPNWKPGNPNDIAGKGDVVRRTRAYSARAPPIDKPGLLAFAKLVQNKKTS